MVALGRPMKSLIRSRGNATKPTPANTMNSSQPMRPHIYLYITVLFSRPLYTTFYSCYFCILVQFTCGFYMVQQCFYDRTHEFLKRRAIITVQPAPLDAKNKGCTSLVCRNKGVKLRNILSGVRHGQNSMRREREDGSQAMSSQMIGGHYIERL